MSCRDPEEHRAEILARRARIQAKSPQLSPEQRMVGAEVYGPLERGRICDLREGFLLEVVGRRWRYDRRIETVGAKRGARTRLTVLFQGEGFTMRWDAEASFRRPLPESRCSDCGAPYYRGLTQDGETELCPSCFSYAEASQ